MFCKGKTILFGEPQIHNIFCKNKVNSNFIDYLAILIEDNILFKYESS